MNCDVMILGAGPAGLQAAIHASRRKAVVVVVGRIERSSLNRAHVENYLCLHGMQEGRRILEAGKNQAKKFGADFVGEDVVELKKEGSSFIAKTESGREVLSKAVILATGISRHKLGVLGEDRLFGRGVSYCADCDARFFQNKAVAVVGGRSAAASAAILLSALARKVYLIAEKLEVNEKLAEQVMAIGVEVLAYSKVESIVGDGKVEELRLPDGTRLKVDGVFIELGSKGAADLAATLGVEVSPDGFIETNKKGETNLPGVFAAGDVCGPPFQVAKALGEGCVAGINAADYAKGIS